jgi:hypothetical protein
VSKAREGIRAAAQMGNQKRHQHHLRAWCCWRVRELKYTIFTPTPHLTCFSPLSPSQITTNLKYKLYQKDYIPNHKKSQKIKFKTFIYKYTIWNKVHTKYILFGKKGPKEQPLPWSPPLALPKNPEGSLRHFNQSVTLIYY